MIQWCQALSFWIMEHGNLWFRVHGAGLFSHRSFRSHRLAAAPLLVLFERLSAIRKFRSYVGLKGAEKKLRRWLADFDFTEIVTANEIIDWTKAPVVKLNNG